MPANKTVIGKSATVDAHVGGRVRLRRTLMGMSQGALGQALGLTFQQVQKYENGRNRISASRLDAMTRILEVDHAFFFSGLSRIDQPNDANHDVMRFVSSAEGIRLNRDFLQIGDDKVRRRIVDLVAALAAGYADEPEDAETARAA